MSYRNQNKPPTPRNPVNKNGALDDPTPDKRRKIGTGWMKASTTASQGRQALAPINNQKDVTVALAPSENEVFEPDTIEFTKEEVNELLNDKFKGKKFDTKVKQEWMTKHIRNLKDCIKWFYKEVEELVDEKDKLYTMLDTSERKHVEAENTMIIKEEKLNSTIFKLENNISSLKAALRSHNREKEARMALEKDKVSLEEDLEKVKKDLSTANDKVKQQENICTLLQEYNKSFIERNKELENQIKTAIEANKQVASEKATILKDHSNLRGNYYSLQKDLTSVEDSRNEAVKQKEELVKEVEKLRIELQKIWEDRESKILEIKELNTKIMQYKESTLCTAAICGKLSEKSVTLEKTCSDQTKKISGLEHQLADANEKLKMADDQMRIISELEKHLQETKEKISEGDKLRKKLHNTILELKGNIRVFCRVRPMLLENGVNATVVSLIQIQLNQETLI